MYPTWFKTSYNRQNIAILDAFGQTDAFNCVLLLVGSISVRFRGDPAEIRTNQRSISSDEDLFVFVFATIYWWLFF